MEQWVPFLNDMHIFVEVVKAGGFRVAAANLDMPNSTVSRRVSALEKAVSLRLLNRTTRSLQLTDVGQIYFERARRIVDDAKLAHEELGDLLVQPSGRLRVSLPIDFANTFLTPLIAEFARSYPQISFDLDCSPRRVDLVSEPFDLAIRLEEPEASNLIARPLARLRPLAFASPGYLERHGTPRHPKDLTKHECLTLPGFDRWILTNGKQTETVSIGSRFHLNDVDMIRRLATLDMGVTMLADEFVVADVAAGRLRRILRGWEGQPTPIFAVTESRRISAKTRTFIEFLRERFRDN